MFADRQRLSAVAGGPGMILGQAIYMSRSRNIMRRLAKETGGGYLEVSKDKSIEQIYAEIEEELRNQYSIGYTPETTGDKKFRKIALTSTRKDLVVRTRAGYYPK
jgi:VWFA-related protein